jgi:hypothetical protein
MTLNLSAVHGAAQSLIQNNRIRNTAHNPARIKAWILIEALVMPKFGHQDPIYGQNPDSVLLEHDYEPT